MMLGNNNSSTLIAVDHHGGGGGSGSGSGEAGTIPGGGGSGGGGFSDEDKARIEVGDSGGGGNRWPRQETLELLRIRSEMEVAFRDSNLKGPLWEEVSRKMSQLGYRRNAKKCKEKFENVYKYHKRTKDGRASKSDGKTYRFFEQLEALEKNPNPNPNLSSLSSPQPQHQLLPPPPRAPVPPTITMVTAVATIASSTNNNPSIPTHVTVPSAPAPAPAPAINPVSFSPSLNNNPLFSTSTSYSHPNPPPALNNPPQGYNSQSSHPNASSSYPSDDQFTSSSTSSDVDIRRRSHKRKRKLKDYFEGMLHNMMEKQEEMHKKFLEMLEKRDRDRMIREEAWRVQEMARMNRELDLLNQERAMATAKDAAIAAFLQKYTGQENIKSPPTPSSNNTPQIQLSLPLPPQNTQPSPPPPIPISQTTTPTPAPPAPPALAPPPMPISQITTQTPVPPPPPPAQPQPPPPPPVLVPARDSYALALSTRNDNGGENFMTPSSSRWPKTEVEALIKLRANMDLKYQDNCPKGPLWEEISSQMSKLGYNRSSKRCKEKWENINKYFKKVKESNKRRHEDSKTCPYFHQLDALYKEKAKTSSDPNTHNPFQISYPNPIKPETPVPIMARPEQQWPIQMHESSSAMDDDEDHDSEHFDENDDVVDEEDDDERERETEGGHEMVTNQRQASMSVATTTAAG